MARIRTIKPEFFTSEDIVSLSPLARLLYVALWCEADKEGRLPWKPMTFKLRYFPGDNCDIQAMCAELVESGLVVKYGDGLAYIPKFGAHQHINPRESASILPPPEELTRGDASARVNSGIDQQVGREGKGREGNDDASPRDTSDRSLDADAPEVKTTSAGLLCKRIRQEAKFTGVTPADPSLLTLMQAGYTDDEIVAVCVEAMSGPEPKGWRWVCAVVQARRRDAERIGKAPGAPPPDRGKKFAGAI